MGPGPEQQRLSPAERSNLVAYLDGELNEAESRAILTKLTQSPTARREKEILERTWELLDHLPRPQTSGHFTERTLSEVLKLENPGGKLENTFIKITHQFAYAALCVGIATLAFGIGFAITAWAWPSPTARLESQLSLAEHFEEYRDVGDFEFLKALASAPEFGTERAE